ncbi:MAG: hypothetical protein HUJ65_03795 [Oscillospiraceae bacterium]|nr:hypothetical protein [Oscillospiraceae bacterium]
MKKTNFRWIIRIVIATFIISMTFTFASAEILGSAGYVMAFVVLAVFIGLGIVFDIIGVAVTAAQEAPFHSMASHRQRGAQEALKLLKNAEKVSSFCNDVVGDISGIVSGATSATIVARIMSDLSTNNVLLQLAVSGLVAALTIGGKALGKTFAMNRSTDIVLSVGKVLFLVNSLFKKR